jgi:hypothetical protein
MMEKLSVRYFGTIVGDDDSHPDAPTSNTRTSIKLAFASLPSLGSPRLVNVYEVATSHYDDESQRTAKELVPLTPTQLKAVFRSKETLFPEEMKVDSPPTSPPTTSTPPTEDIENNKTKIGASSHSPNSSGTTKRTQVISMNDELERVLGFTRSEYVFAFLVSSLSFACSYSRACRHSMISRARRVGWHMNICFGDPAESALYFRFILCATLGLQSTFSMKAHVATKVRHIHSP